MRTLGQAILLVLTIVALAAPAGASHDARGKITTLLNWAVAGEDRSFGYDPNGRLLTSTGPWGSGSYGYDALSNIRTRSEGTSGASTVAYASNNRVTSAVVNGASRTYAYDARGNTTSIGSSGFAYDFNNQPVTVTGTGAATFLYDGNLKRVKEVRAGKTIYTVYSRVTGGLIWKDEATDLKQTAYVSAGQASVRFGYNNGTLATAEYIHADHLGSPIAATNAAGNVTWRESYRPFGKALRIFGSAPANDNSTGFTGHLEDDASGLVYMQARYYDPLVGRFLATDPIGYQDQLNLYAYVHNDPVNKTDPTGEYIESLIDIGFLIADVAAIADSGFTAGNVAAVIGDLAGLAAPGATGGGLAARAAVEGVQAAAKAAGNAGDAAKVGAKSCCFVAGTLVETADGLKPIEKITVGDLVLARNVETGETALKAVTDLIRRHERVIWEISLTGLDGETARFETTDDHPWWIAGQGWKKTAELEPGMAVVTKDGRGMVVASVTETDRNDSTYNLTIADFETYFVGENGVLVHNCPTGSYTNTHESGKTYDGKGNADRAAESGDRVGKANNDPLAKTETRGAPNDRESFKQESRSLDANGGPKSDSNYNKIDSPGKNYRIEDKEIDP